jgi:uncharacterized membrane protein
MSTLVAVIYEDEYRAAEVLATLKRLQSEYLLDLEEAAYVTKDREGKVKVHAGHHVTAEGAIGGGLWGMLIGLLFFVPIAGLALGAGIGALAVHFSDYGIDRPFVEKLRAAMKPGTSAIFVLLRTDIPDKAVPEIAKYGGTIFQTSLSSEAEAKLQAALNEAAGAKAGGASE